MARTEDIEAKLAAYVDGELDAAGRAEIEKHLAANPQHRLLIEQLARQRDLLRNLPRETAPTDVAETINAQLERAVLLGDVDSEVEAASLRISPWPQIRAVAAVLLLTVSLAAIIYYLLPSPSRKPSEFADLTGPTTMPESSLAPLTETEAANMPKDVFSLAEGGAIRATGHPGGVTSPLATETPQEQRAKLALGGGAPQPQAAVSNTASSTDQMFRETVAGEVNLRTPVAEGRTLYVVVPTKDPAITNLQVQHYLTRNGFTWRGQAEPMPLPLQLGQQQTAFADRVRQVSPQFDAPATAPSTAPIDTIQQFVLAYAMPRQQAIELSNTLNRLPESTRIDEGKAALSLGPASSPVTQPAALEVIEAAKAKSEQVGSDQFPQPPTVAAPEQQAATTVPTSQPSTTKPVARRIAAGDELSISVPQLLGPGVEPTTSQRVGVGGSIAMPMLEPFSVAGLTESELSELIARKYRDTKLIPDAAPTVTLLAPATQPFDLRHSQTSAGSATTQPLASEDLVDVVILVKPEPPATQPTAEPATQPQSPPATEPAVQP